MFNTDERGIIGQIQIDGSIEGGDSACWMGHYVYTTGSDFPYVKTFEVKPGAYVRHPNPSSTYMGFGSYYKNPWNGCMSRDQLTGVIGALIKQREYKALLRFIAHHACRGFLFSYNTIKNGVDPTTAKLKMPDLTLFDFWATYLRGFGKFSYIFYPLLCILDLHLLVNTILTNFSKDDDQVNYALKLMVSLEYIPTPISKLAAKILNKNHLCSLLKNYWCGWRQNDGLYILQKRKLDELL